jgi:hypothetical protein
MVALVTKPGLARLSGSLPTSSRLHLERCKSDVIPGCSILRKMNGVHTSLFDLPVHLFELVDGVFLDMVFYDLDTLVVLGEVRSVAFQPDHV